MTRINPGSADCGADLPACVLGTCKAPLMRRDRAPEEGVMKDGENRLRRDVSIHSGLTRQRVFCYPSLLFPALLVVSTFRCEELHLARCVLMAGPKHTNTPACTFFSYNLT